MSRQIPAPKSPGSPHSPANTYGISCPIVIAIPNPAKNSILILISLYKFQAHARDSLGMSAKNFTALSKGSNLQDYFHCVCTIQCTLQDHNPLIFTVEK